MAMDFMTVSSKGQVVIPAEIRKELSINTGDELLAFSYGDSIMIKKVKLPSREKMQEEIVAVNKAIGKKVPTEEDINNIIKAYRENKRK